MSTITMTTTNNSTAATTTENKPINMSGARHYKNPTQEMLAQAEENDERMGGMIFVQKSCRKRGKFLTPKTIKTSQFLTDSKEIDFSLTDFAVPVTTIHLKDFLGGVKLIVPPGVRVETQSVGVLSDTKHSKVLANADYDNGPLIVVRGAHALSKVKVTVNDKVQPIEIVQ